VTIPRGHEDEVLFHTVHLFVDDRVRPELARTRALNLIVLRLQMAGTNAPPHLGEIHISSPEFAV
jgi:hypothetical protein